MSSMLLIRISIHQNSEWLGEDFVNGSDEALSAHEDRKYTLVKAGACLEGLLNQSTLGPLTGALRNFGSVPPELLERLNEANTIRNREPHDNPTPLSRVTEGDLLQIINILGLMVSWHQGQFHQRARRLLTCVPYPFFSVWADPPGIKPPVQMRMMVGLRRVRDEVIKHARMREASAHGDDTTELKSGAQHA